MGDITLSAVLDRVTDILWRQRNGEALEVPLKSLLLLLPRESERELAERKKKERKKRKNDVGILRCKNAARTRGQAIPLVPPPPTHKMSTWRKRMGFHRHGSYCEVRANTAE